LATVFSLIPSAAAICSVAQPPHDETPDLAFARVEVVVLQGGAIVKGFAAPHAL
jgi:hypothetical protein